MSFLYYSSSSILNLTLCSPLRRPLQIEEENAALLAALTDSLDGMVDAEVGGLSVFQTLGEGPNQEEEDDDAVLPLNTGDFSQSLGTETEDPSLVGRALTSSPVWSVAARRVPMAMSLPSW